MYTKPHTIENMKDKLDQVISFRVNAKLAKLLREQDKMGEFIQEACEYAVEKKLGLIPCPKCKSTGFIKKRNAK